MKVDVQNHMHKCQMPDLIRDAYNFDENHGNEQCYTSPITFQNK